MKKSLALALSLALVQSMGASALAANIDTDGGTKDIDVNARYVDSIQTPTVYDVDVTWGAMEFTYTVSGTKTWNAESHSYTVSSSGSWSANGNEITVTNHSNTDIQADFSYAAETGYESVTCSFSNAAFALPSAENKAVTDSALTGKTSLTLAGTLSDSTESLTKVGSVTLAISKAQGDTE